MPRAPRRASPRASAPHCPRRPRRPRAPPPAQSPMSLSIFASPLTKMAQDGSKSENFIGRSNSLKRHRQPVEEDDDEDVENTVPPNKKSNIVTFPDSISSGIPSSSPLLLSDDGSSGTLTENQDSHVSSSFTDSGSEESVSHHLPHTSKILSPINNISNKLSYNNYSIQNPSTSNKKCPLPNFQWADRFEVWRRMFERDLYTANQRSPNLLDQHPSLKLRMRAILLDWLNEVCDVYKLHRETFHLCLNYIDRYLSHTKNVHKNRLQLIGITCLFIAAKVDEVYPPKLSEFAYVTDSACTQEEILLEEILILSTLSWEISPITANHWLNIFLQLSSEKDLTKVTHPPETVYKEYTRDTAFLFTQYSSLDFIICAQLIDLAVLHVGVNNFKNSQLAAAAVAHIFDRDIAMKVSGYTWEELEPCYTWLNPFARVLEEACGSKAGIRELRTLPDCGNNVSSSGGLSHVCPNINPDQSHRIQVHNISMDYFDKVEEFIATSKENCAVPVVSFSNEARHENVPSASPKNQSKTNSNVDSLI